MERDELIALGLEDAAIERILENEQQLRADYEGRIEAVKREYEVERLLSESGARNVKAVRALVTGGDVESVKAEIERLKNDEETKFLFEKRGSFHPARSPERLPDVKKNSFEERLNAARRAGNTIEAIRIKQQAASEGVMLL
ncbi:MAG: phage scaffolding protein [Clostridia bacterium]|nr:phage scaffolding protein [Clostridia bacterium]